MVVSFKPYTYNIQGRRVGTRRQQTTLTLTRNFTF